MTLATELLTLKSGIQICAPADINLMSNFVLREQGDWFEDEIHFIRDFIKPGMTALDIGANYGLYSTTIARAIGEQGKLWCFEPTPDTAKALRETINCNGFDDRTEIIEAGLSDHQGEASFYLSSNAELNSLTPSDNEQTSKVTIALQTLDQCAQEHQWPNIDFVKLDAEGEEIKILQGGKTFFESQAPVVMFELKHGSKINLPLIDAFEGLGYQIYYLIPGLNVLAPFDKTQKFDPFLLNLFALTEQRAEQLCGQGLVVNNPTSPADEPGFKLASTIAELACYRGFELDFNGLAQRDDLYAQTLKAYFKARDPELGAQARYNALAQAISGVNQAGQQGSKQAEHLITYARIAYDAGERALGNHLLKGLFDLYIKPSRAFNIRDIFVLPGPEFEQSEHQGKPDAWLCCAVLDQLCRKLVYSCFFGAVPETMKFIEVMSALGFVQPDMLARASLIQERATKQAAND